MTDINVSLAELAADAESKRAALEVENERLANHITAQEDIIRRYREALESAIAWMGAAKETALDQARHWQFGVEAHGDALNSSDAEGQNVR